MVNRFTLDLGKVFAAISPLKKLQVLIIRNTVISTQLLKQKSGWVSK